MTGQADQIISARKGSNENSKSKSKIIIVASNKGGTGKSFLSLNLGSALSKRYRVLVIDMDRKLSSLHLLLNVSPKYTLTDYLIGKCLFNECIYRYSDKMNIIFNNIDISDTSVPDSRHITGAIKRTEGYDFIIIDTGGGELTYNKELFEISDSIIVTATPEPSSIMDAYMMMKYFVKNCIKGKKLLLLNKSSSNEALEAFENVNTAALHFLKTGIKLIGNINDDELVSQSVKMQKILFDYYPESETAAQVSETALKLIQYMHMDNISHSDTGIYRKNIL